MKALFNGTCSRCQEFRPYCALVILTGPAPQQQAVLCKACRADLLGKYRLDPQHRGREEKKRS